MIPYITPFAIYIILSLLGAKFEHGTYYIYPLKTILVACSLIFYRKHYTELLQKIKFNSIYLTAFIGILVFLIWIIPEGLYQQLGDSQFNPYIFSNPAIVYLLIFFRLLGAAVVVPIFEELFWRSFLIRWIINPDFKKVQIGQFSWVSFIITTLFFGLEHHRWIVGLIAGAIYNYLLYKEKNIWNCIIAHAITNLVLGIYVLITRQWGFW